MSLIELMDWGTLILAYVGPIVAVLIAVGCFVAAFRNRTDKEN